MKPQYSEVQVLPYPKIRRFLEAAIRSTHHKPMTHGFVMMEGQMALRLTASRQRLAAHSLIR
jgi:hypothetical protein